MLTMEKGALVTAWPMLAGLGPLGALPTASRLCRAFAVLVLAGWGLCGLADDCELVTGELVANVVQAATRAGRAPRLRRGRAASGAVAAAAVGRRAAQGRGVGPTAGQPGATRGP